MRLRYSLVLLLALSLLIACGQKPQTPATSTTPGGETQTATPDQKIPGTRAKAAPEKAVTLPAGTVLTVRLAQAVGSKISRPGDTFSATLARPVEVNGAVVVPVGAAANGTVAEAVPRGRFKGAAKLRITLDSVEIGGKSHRIETAAVTQSAKGKGKRSATLIGGGAGVGALIGGLAGGGKGAAIGAIAGAGAGTAGAAFTGNKDIVLPAESALSFKLTQPLEVR